jgi:hypothetical protein
MRRLALSLWIGAGLLGAYSYHSATREAAAQPASPPGLATPAPARIDSFVAERDSLMNDLLRSIAGRENAPADSVFKNIKSMKGVPAGRLLRIMNVGFGKSLGVSCRHCHVPGHWADEDKPQKQVARDMMDMSKRINQELLPAIKNLKSEHPVVNCTTCHRGSPKPAIDMAQR